MEEGKNKMCYCRKIKLQKKLCDKSVLHHPVVDYFPTLAPPHLISLLT